MHLLIARYWMWSWCIHLSRFWQRHNPDASLPPMTQMTQWRMTRRKMWYVPSVYGNGGQGTHSFTAHCVVVVAKQSNVYCNALTPNAQYLMLETQWSMGRSVSMWLCACCHSVYYCHIWYMMVHTYWGSVGSVFTLGRRAIWHSSELLLGRTSTKLMPRMTLMVSLYSYTQVCVAPCN